MFYASIDTPMLPDFRCSGEPLAAYIATSPDAMPLLNAIPP